VHGIQRRFDARTDALVAARVARHVLRHELSLGSPGLDWSVDADSLPIRAFRGTALVCPLQSASAELRVWYRGDRSPDPTKDSLLLIDGVGRREVRALTAVYAEAEPCSGDVRPVNTWRLDAAVPPGVVIARLFERGSYHVSTAALRYRRGDSGRQPLTPEVWSEASEWTRVDGALRLVVVPRDSLGGRPWQGFLGWLDAP
jgi:hypothetical protein